MHFFLRAWPLSDVKITYYLCIFLFRWATCVKKLTALWCILLWISLTRMQKVCPHNSSCRLSYWYSQYIFKCVNLLFSVSNMNVSCLSDEETHTVDLSSLSNKLLPGLTTLGFKDDRRHKGTTLYCYSLFCHRCCVCIICNVL